jgi:hypothetical protein
VGQRTKNFTIAVLVTILDAGVVVHYGPILWQVFGQVSWMRLGLLLFAGTGTFTLADIWSRPFSRSGRRPLLTEISEGGAAGSPRNSKLEGAGV